MEGLAEMVILVLILTAPGVLGFFGIYPFIVLGMWHQSRKMEQKVLSAVPKPDKGWIHFSVSGCLDLESSWWEKLSWPPRDTQYNHGSEGERLLKHHLSTNVSSDYICIPNLMVDTKLDADLVLIGPNGIWVLESKYISGHISLRNGIWSRKKSFYSPGGVLNSKVDNLGTIEDQWLREKSAIENTLNRSFPAITKAHPALVKGGLVFSHNRSSIDADSSSRVPWGNFKMWAGEINASGDNTGHPQKPILSESEVMDIAEVLLAQSKRIDPNQTRSSVGVENIVYINQKRKFKELSEKYFQQMEPEGTNEKSKRIAEEFERDRYSMQLEG